MKDRQPTKPGRVALTDELTGETRYYTVEMADEPTTEGDPPTKATLLTDAVAQKYGKTAAALPTQILDLLSAAALYQSGSGLKTVTGGDISIPASQIIQAAVIETGSYTGNGDYGSAHPTSITFTKIVPEIVFLVGDGGSGEETYSWPGTMFIRDVNYAAPIGYGDRNADMAGVNAATWQQKSLSWYYNDTYVYGAVAQGNADGYHYKFIGIGFSR